MKPPILIIATGHGLFTASSQNGTWQARPAGLASHHVTAVIARAGVILAGTTDGIWRSNDLGQTWSATSAGLGDRHVRWLAFHPDISDLEFAGTEPAGLYISKDRGANWTARAEVAALRDEFDWFLPYSPAAGCVRGFACCGQRLYAAVEVGGLLRSDDGGSSWALAPGSRGLPDFNHPTASSDIHPDVHDVVVYPGNHDLVYAPTGGGFYRSQDGGATWHRRHPAGYTRAVWVDPANPEHILLGSAQPVSRHGDIVVSRDGGASWAPANVGLGAPWPRDMVERFCQVGAEMLAVTDNGRLFSARIDTWRWAPALADVTAINAVCALVA